MFPVNGPTFLVIYVVLFAAAVIAYFSVRYYLTRRAEARTVDVIDPIAMSLVTPQVAAFLVEGDRRVGPTRAILSFVHKQDVPLDDADSLLARHGLIASAAERAALRLWGAALFGGLLAAGAARLFIGISRDRPVGFLFLLLVFVGWVLVASVRHRLLRTSTGDQVMSELISRYRSGIGDVSAAMGFALLGWSELADPLLHAHLTLQGYSATSSGTISGTSLCIGGCSGGGGCGGGGCGGGCGGCT